MQALLVSVLIAASGDSRVIEDPRGFHFTVPAGFESFPDFKPAGNKLYAFGKNLGTPDAITFTVDLVEGQAVAGKASKSCELLMNSIDRTIGTPIAEDWGGAALSGLRMVMTHMFGEVIVYCVDVPVRPEGVTLMVSGKVENQAVLHEVFASVLGSIGVGSSWSPAFIVVGLGVGFVVLGLLRWRRRRE